MSDILVDEVNIKCKSKSSFAKTGGNLSVDKKDLLDSESDRAIYNLRTVKPFYKPFYYPWAYSAWLTQQQIHWLPEEVPMGDDVKDWKFNLTSAEKELLTQVFRFFTQADIEVNNCYIDNYCPIFKPIEVRMMLISFAAMETVHIAAYAHLLDTMGMPEVEYQAFMKYKEMKDKYDYMQEFDMNSDMDIAVTLAVFGAFTEGLQLFASFAILLNFQRYGKMKGMCQIIAWSVRDETLHTMSVIKLFHTFITENPSVAESPGSCIPSKAVQDRLYEACNVIIEHEDALLILHLV